MYRRLHDCKTSNSIDPSHKSHNASNIPQCTVLLKKRFCYKIVCCGIYGTGALLGMGQVNDRICEIGLQPSQGWFRPSQCEASLQSNAVSHWLGANLESALELHSLALSQWYMKTSCHWDTLLTNGQLYGAVFLLLLVLRSCWTNSRVDIHLRRINAHA